MKAARTAALGLIVMTGIVTALCARAALAAEPAPVGSAVVVDLLGLPTPPPVVSPQPPTERARTTYAQRCAHCHGPSGRGDGALAPTLAPPPRNFADRAWQTATTDAAMAETIRLGGAAMKKSALMPAHPDLDASALAELAHLLRSFAEPAVPTVRLSLERIEAAPSAAVVVSEKRLRLRTGALRARFDAVPPGKVRVRGFVDLDGDGQRADGGSEPAFVGPVLDVGAAEVRSSIAVDRAGEGASPPAPTPGERRE